MMFEDRTKCHADQVGEGNKSRNAGKDVLISNYYFFILFKGFERQTTAAAGVLKAVHCGQPYSTNRIVKGIAKQFN